MQIERRLNINNDDRYFVYHCDCGKEIMLLDNSIKHGELPKKLPKCFDCEKKEGTTLLY